MNRRTLIEAVAASAALPLLNRVAAAQTSPKTKNVVLVHGLFAATASISVRRFIIASYSTTGDFAP